MFYFGLIVISFPLQEFKVDETQFIIYDFYFGLVCCMFCCTLFSDRTSLRSRQARGESQPLLLKVPDEIEDTFDKKVKQNT